LSSLDKYFPTSAPEDLVGESVLSNLMTIFRKIEAALLTHDHSAAGVRCSSTSSADILLKGRIRSTSRGRNQDGRKDGGLERGNLLFVWPIDAQDANYDTVVEQILLGQEEVG
ncbi:unnamed protein product, partial [Amoebophrya sp. A25]